MTSERRPEPHLRVLQAGLYLATVFLWFKDNFPFGKAFPLSPLWTFLPLAAVTLLRLRRWAKTWSAEGRRRAGSADWKKDAAAIGIIVVLVILTRLPFLAHSFGLMDSDEAIPALMGKHIAEGGRPPLYFYGAFFQGSLPQHYTAVFFKLFGYSVFLAKLSALLAFGAFLVVQFFLLKKAFSFGVACLAGLFYVLPWHELVRTSLDLASGFPVVLFLGSLAFYLTAGIVFEDKAKRLAVLGFVLGLAFWSHQISIIFCVTVAPFLIYKFRLRLKSYLELGVYFLIGSFPLLVNEFARSFPIVRVFFLGQAGSTGGHKLRHARRFLLALFSSGPPAASLIYLGVIAAGFLSIILLVVRKKTPPASLVLAAYFVSFMAVYLLSESSKTYVVRYLYILYIALPVLLGAVFLWLKPKVGLPAAAAFFLLAFALSQAGVTHAYYEEVRVNQGSFSRAVNAMKETGEKFWISDFWTSYLLTSLAGEKLIVACKDVRRYYPYELFYWSEGRNNWVISKYRDENKLYATVIPEVADRAGITYGKKETEGYTLIYRLSQDIFPRIILADPPQKLPEVRLSETEARGGELSLKFTREDSSPTPGLGFRVEIPRYCVRFFPMWERDGFTAKVPLPLKEKTTVGFGYTYAGLRLKGGTQEAGLTIGPAELAQPRPAVVFLEGVGPQRDFSGRPVSVCRKVARLEVNRPPDKSVSLALDLYSPFDFYEPWWYGDFSQRVSIFVNDRSYGERNLVDGENRVLVKLDPEFFSGRGDIVRLEFKYAMPMSYAENFKTSAYLERVGFE